MGKWDENKTEYFLDYSMMFMTVLEHILRTYLKKLSICTLGYFIDMTALRSNTTSIQNTNLKIDWKNGTFSLSLCTGILVWHNKSITNIFEKKI